MNKMEQNKLKAQSVNKLKIALVLALMLNCAPKESQPDNDDYKLLSLYVSEQIASQKANNPKNDSLVFGLSNTNSFILNKCKEYLELKQDSFLKMPKSTSKIVNGKMIFVDIVKGDSIYKSELNKPWINIKLDSIVHKVYADAEYANYKKQLSNGQWDSIVYKKFKTIHPPNSETKRAWYMSKPMYTINKKYALLYGFVKPNGIYPYIIIYEKRANKWYEIHQIKPGDF